MSATTINQIEIPAATEHDQKQQPDPLPRLGWGAFLVFAIAFLFERYSSAIVDSFFISLLSGTCFISGLAILLRGVHLLPGIYDQA